MKLKPNAAIATILLLLMGLMLAACGDTATSAANPTAASTTTSAAATTSAASTTTTAAGTTAMATTTSAATTTTAGTTTAAATTAMAATTAAGTAAATTTTGATTSAAGNGQKPTIIVGSKNFTEDILVAQMYAQVLQNAGFPVQTKLDLGSVDIAQQAITKGDISIYPEYTGTALGVVLKQTTANNDPQQVLQKVQDGYKSQYNLTVLNAAPMNDSNGVVVTKAVADKYNLKTLSDLSKVANQLTFAAIADFVGPRSNIDGIGSLQKTYGGFKFKNTQIVDIKIKYDALKNGQADAGVAFTTDPQIQAYNLVLMEDDKHNFPPYQMIPIIRPDILAAYPNVADLINNLSSKITTEDMQKLNGLVDINHQDAATVAKQFLQQQGLLK